MVCESFSVVIIYTTDCVKYALILQADLTIPLKVSYKKQSTKEFTNRLVSSNIIIHSINCCQGCKYLIMDFNKLYV